MIEAAKRSTSKTNGGIFWRVSMRHIKKRESVHARPWSSDYRYFWFPFRILQLRIEVLGKQVSLRLLKDDLKTYSSGALGVQQLHRIRFEIGTMALKLNVGQPWTFWPSKRFYRWICTHFQTRAPDASRSTTGVNKLKYSISIHNVAKFNSRVEPLAE